MRLNALFRLAFAPAPPHGLTLPHTVTRRLILQKARHRGHGRSHDDALTACKPTVSGTISLPSRGTFHLSLTVLVHYRSPSVYLALRGGPRRFTPAFPVPALLGNTDRRLIAFRVRGSYPLRRGRSRTASPTHQLCNSVKGLVPRPIRSHDPAPATPPGLTPARFRLFPFRSPLLRESRLLSFPRGTEMFQFPRFPLPALCVQAGVTPHDGCRVSPFGHPRIKAW